MKAEFNSYARNEKEQFEMATSRLLETVSNGHELLFQRDPTAQAFYEWR